MSWSVEVNECIAASKPRIDHRMQASGLHFSAHTFRYFEGARKHADDREWFEANRTLYAEHVEVPFTHLVHLLKDELGPALPGVVFSPRRISRPLLRQGRNNEGPLVRSTATAFLSEPATSMFETNPGLYVSFGAEASENVLGCGLYMPSARQVRELRPRFLTDHLLLDEIFATKSLKKHWGGLAGDLYKRFPRDLDERLPGATYGWRKQWFLSRQLTREQVCDRRFANHALQAFAAAVPFLCWTRAAVGLYRKLQGEADG